MGVQLLVFPIPLILRFQSLSLSRILKFLVMLPRSLELHSVKLFTNLIFQASNVTTAELGLSAFLQYN